MEGSTNRRRHPRVKPKQLVTRIRSGEDLHIGLGIENISMGGLFVRCNTPMKVGLAVTLEVMRAGSAAPLAIEGKVTSTVSLATAAKTSRAAGMAISFDPLPPHIEQRLEGLILSIDPSVKKLQLQPPPKRVATKVPAPVLQERTDISAAHTPSAPIEVPSKTLVPAARRPPSDGADELFMLQRRVQDLERENAQLQSEVQKLQKRLLNLVNNGG